MFNRYSIAAKSEDVGIRFNVDVPAYYKPRYNAAPTHLLPVITQQTPVGVSLFYWGLSPEWAKNKTLGERAINVRVETIPEKGIYRKALMQRRCLMPATGLFVWKKIGKKTVVPYRVVLKNMPLFSMPGFWEEFEDEAGDSIQTFTVITRAANEPFTDFGERMPVIFTPAQEKIWLAPDAAEESLLPLLSFELNAAEYDLYSVSPAVNSPSYESELVIRPAPPADQFGNLTLFG
ncbi:MAG: SOS response-associated peptidase [Cyclobacteriaceae bacterium]|nr:SOS response-associated peptidase [Cyclobacteriaceae bacterium]